MISYSPFFETIERKRVSLYYLRTRHGISNGTFHRMRKGMWLSTRSINDFCRILNCRVEDVMTYIPDDEGK